MNRTWSVLLSRMSSRVRWFTSGTNLGVLLCWSVRSVTELLLFSWSLFSHVTSDRTVVGVSGPMVSINHSWMTHGPVVESPTNQSLEKM